MLKKISYLVFIICTALPLWSQNEAANWYFGNQAGLDFNSGIPVAQTDGQLITTEGCAAISNPAGELLFYTDGTTVYNANHLQMLNGDNLLGNFSSTQSAIIVPAPGNSNLYYVFTVAAQGGADGLNYSVVDMTLDGGLGGVTAIKNVRLDNPYLVAEKLTAVLHTDGEQVWVISHRMDSNRFIAFLVSSSGINTTPVVSAVGRNSGSGGAGAIGYLKASPDGKKLASAKQYVLSDLELFDFDASTGIISNPMLLNQDAGYGVEFSPDGKRLYFSIFSSNIYQYDITQPDLASIIASRTLIATGSFAALQVALDGKIYVTKNVFTEKTNLAVIHNPNNLGAACNFQYTGPSLGGKTSELGLPPFIQTFFLQYIMRLVHIYTELYRK